MIFKKWWFWVLVVVLGVIGGIGGSIEDKSPSSSMSSYTNEDKLVSDSSGKSTNYEYKTGRTVEDIILDLRQNYSSYIPGCASIDYISHQFDENENADIVKIEWSIDSNYLITKNTGYMKFVYLDGEWNAEEISKIESIYKLKLEGTYWEPSFREYWNSDRPDNVDYILSEISNDSSVITFKDNFGNSYKARITSDSYIEDFENGYSISYSFEDQNPYIKCDISGYNNESYKNGPVIKMYNSTTQTQMDYNLNPLYYMKK